MNGDIVLLFPPDCREVNEACIYTTEIMAYLQRQGLAARQIDANIGFQTYIGSPEGFREVQAYGRRFCRERFASKQPEKEEEERRKSVLWLSETREEVLYPLLSEAFQGIRTEEGYFEFETYFLYKSVINHYDAAIKAMCRLPGSQKSYRTWSDIRRLLEKGTPYDSYLLGNLMEQILSAKPKLVDIFVTAYGQMVPAFVLGEALKRRGIHVVLSDSLPTVLREDILAQPDIFDAVDGVILYEQEHALTELHRQISGEKDYFQVPNYLFRHEGKVIRTAPARPMKAEEIPMPSFDGLDFSAYLAAVPALPYAASRGCWWGKCRFCNLHKGASGYLQKTPEKVAEDVCRLREKYGVRTILFYDNVLQTDVMMEIARALIRKKADIRWNAVLKLTRVITPEEAELLYRSGCRSLEFELESVNRKSHRLMETGVDPDIYLESMKNTKQKKIMNTVSLLYGLYGEGPEDFARTNRFAAEHKDVIDGALTFALYIAKDSGLYRDREKYGLLLDKRQPDLLTAYDQYEGDGWSSGAQREAGAADLFERTYGEYPYFLSSYLPVLNYVIHYHCSDPVLLSELCDHRQRTNPAVPRMHRYVVKLEPEEEKKAGCRSGEKASEAVSGCEEDNGKEKRPNQVPLLYNLSNSKYFRYEERFREIEPFIDGKADTDEILTAFAREKGMNRGMAMLKYLPVLNRYRGFMT